MSIYYILMQLKYITLVIFPFTIILTSHVKYNVYIFFLYTVFNPLSRSVSTLLYNYVIVNYIIHKFI